MSLIARNKVRILAAVPVLAFGAAVNVAQADAIPSLTMQWFSSSDLGGPSLFNLHDQSNVNYHGDGTWNFLGGQSSQSSWNMEWDMTVNSNSGPGVITGSGGPFVTADLAVTNTSASVQSFFALVTLTLDQPITGGTLMNGQVSAGVTDFLGTGATVSTISSGQFAGDPIFTALIDGNEVQSLMNDPTNVTANPFSSNSEAATFGQPGPIAGPDAMNTISVWLKFDLTPGDTANVVGTFQIVAVPAPAALPALALFGLLAGTRRRRRC